MTTTNKVIVQKTITSINIEGVVNNIYLWNNGKWSQEWVYNALHNLIEGNFIFLEAFINNMPVGYFLLVFDTSTRRIVLPIENVFPHESINKLFPKQLRAEVVFTIVNPIHRGKKVFRNFLTPAFWNVINKRTTIILAELEKEKIALYQSMGIPIYPLSKNAVEYQGGPCYPCMLSINIKILLQSILFILLIGSPRVISFSKRAP